MKYVDDITLTIELVLVLTAFRGAIAAWRSGRPASVFCAMVALCMTIGALSYGMFLLALSRRPEGAMIARFPGQMPGMGAMFALMIGLPAGLFFATILSVMRWAINYESRGAQGIPVRDDG